MFRVQPNQKANMFTLISYAGKLDGSGDPLWLCTCECGKTVEKPISSVLRSHIKSCGCVFANYVEARKKDLTNERYKKLLVIGKTGKRSESNLGIWLCECDCGGFIEIPTGEWRTKSSCGCYAMQLITSEEAGMLHQDGTNIGVLLKRKPPRSASGVTGVYFRPKSQKWRACLMFQRKKVLDKEFETQEEAVAARQAAEDIYHTPSLEKYIEYRNSESNNMARQVLQKRGASSGTIGVTYNKGTKKWRARMRFNGKLVLDKVYDTLVEAVAARKAAETQYIGGGTEE